MKRDLRSKKMPAKPMQEAQADDELALDMPMSDEEMGSEEAEEDLLMDENMEPGPMDEFSDEDLIAEMQKRGLSAEDLEADAMEEEAEEELPAEEEML